MTARTKRSQGTWGLSVTELVAWVAGLAAFLGLIQEFLRRASTDRESGFFVGILIFYVIYLSFTVPLFWIGRRIAIPITLLVSSVLWTLSLQFAAKATLVWTLASLLAVPPLTAFLVSRIFPASKNLDQAIEPAPEPSTVRTLLAKEKRLGTEGLRDHSGSSRP